MAINNHHHGNHRCTFPKGQAGAVLLAFTLLIIIASSYYLARKLNTNLAKTQHSQETGIALNAARNALIGYAITFPDHDVSGVVDGPGYLPCPDLNNDGSAAANCSLAGNTTIGRLPNQTLRLEELRDASGQRLWYALSENFRFGNNKTIPLNSESPSSAELSINGTADIVAIIFAPGEPFDNQDRVAAVNDVTNYLEDDNSNLDTSFVTTANGDFNDRLVVITRQELMQAVEKRVLGEVGQILTTYFNTHGAYPWLAPFADPKASKFVLSGEHDGGNGAATLTDSTRDFSVWGVAIGDVVRNLTDGSVGTVTAVAATTLTIGGGMSLGTGNDFDNNDEYYIYPAALAGLGQLRGVATNANNNASLEDAANNFSELDISPGDIVDNLTDGSSGVVDTVSANELTFLTLPNTLTLSGGAENDFDNGENYRIRSQHGQAAAGTNSLTLEDANNNFVVMDVQASDLIINLTDGSFGRVSAVAVNVLTVDALYFGSDNSFEVNDYYFLPRNTADNNAREGLLAFHEVGKHFPTAFDIDWDFVTAAAADISFDAVTFPGVQATYSTAVETYLDSYAEDGGTQSFANSNGTCIWLLADTADCYGSFKDFVNISGTLTSGTNTVVITDTTAEFNTNGIKRGDIAQDYDDETSVISGTADVGSTGTTLVDAAVDFSVYEPYSYVIQNNTLEIDLGVSRIQGVVANIIDADTLEAVSYVGETATPIEFRVGDSYTIFQPFKAVVTSVSSETQLSTVNYTSAIAPDFDTAEYYRIMPAANSYSGTVTSVLSTGTPDRFRDASANFLAEGISVGDIVVNTSIGAVGEITAVVGTGIQTTLYNGAPNDFAVGNTYTVYHDYVFSREHIFHAKYRGNQATNTVSEKRVRDVCMGYNADCSATAAVNFSGNGGTPLMTLRDYEEDETTEVGRATFTPSAASNGSIRLSNVDYYLWENNGDFPSWLLTNKWHQLIYIAYSAGDSPNGGAICTVSTDCLTLTGGGSPDDNKRAIVISAGEPLANPLPTQDRTSGSISDYYENGNNNAGDDGFQIGEIMGTFNDQVRVLDTSL